MNRVDKCLLALVVAVGAFGNHALAQMQNIQLGDQRYELKFTIGDEDSDIFFQAISAASIGPDGQIVVSDSPGGQIVVYSASGDHLWTVDSKGEGPGELSRFGKAWFVNNQIHFTNQRGTRIDYYSMAGEFESSTAVNEFGFDRAGICGWLDENRMVLTRSMSASYGNHTYVIDRTTGAVLNEREFRLPGVDDPPRGFSIGVGCEVLDGSVFIGHAFADGYWKLTDQLKGEQYVAESEGNMLPPVLTRFDNGNLSAMFPVEVDLTAIDTGYVFTNVRWPCEPDTVEKYQAAAKAGETITRCRTQRLFDTQGELIEIVYDGPNEEVPFAFIWAGEHDTLVVQPDEEYPMAAVYRLVK